ncbi:MAG TPA: LytTR family DNA-binding domain-containing protein [Candidatus Udaeobacter sp.]|jgi:two-component system LytT family response regulator|nr:LytTR family DNA-binding domain-containing protein [Candidatus Udaeobacter sp.]
MATLENRASLEERLLQQALRVLIVDDERIARQRLRWLLEKEQNVQVAGECRDGGSVEAAVKEHRPDLVLLDIKMPDMNGFDVVHALEPCDQPAVVFVTAFDNHAVHAFETCALDYLLKPVAAARLAKTLARVRRHLRSARAAAPPVALSSDHRFSVRCGYRTTFVAPEQIDWIEASGNYAILHVDAQNHLLRETMAHLESVLPPGGFMRVSRSAIVRLSRVKEIQTTSTGHHFAVLDSGMRVCVTKSIREVAARLR